MNKLTAKQRAAQPNPLVILCITNVRIFGCFSEFSQSSAAVFFYVSPRALWPCRRRSPRGRDTSACPSVHAAFFSSSTSRDESDEAIYGVQRCIWLCVCCLLSAHSLADFFRVGLGWVGGEGGGGRPIFREFPANIFGLVVFRSSLQAKIYSPCSSGPTS